MSYILGYLGKCNVNDVELDVSASFNLKKLSMFFKLTVFSNY